MFYKTAKLRNMLNRLDKRAFVGKAREKRAIAALLGPLFRAASRAPLTTAAAGLGGMAGYEFARQPKKLANPALLPNASTAPPPNNDAALQKTSLDRQILGALLRR
jgi:surfactin synthase thioesterase subunit